MPQAVDRRTRRIRRALTSRWAYGFVLPALLIFTVFTIGPTIYAFAISGFEWNWLNPDLIEFVGAKNYVDLIQGNRDPSFFSTMMTSLYFVSAMVIGGTVLSLALAMLLRPNTKLLYGVRTVVFLAYITPVVATSIVWVWIYNPRFGLANSLLRLFGGGPVDWLGNDSTAMLAVILFSLWHELGFTTIVFIGGLTTLDKSLSEAARIDGASWWSEFRFVTLPQLRPFVAFVIVIASVSSLQAFTQFFVMTGGGPGFDTATLGYAVYQQAFVYRKTGYAAALAVVLFVLTAGLSVLQMQASRRARR